MRAADVEEGSAPVLRDVPDVVGVVVEVREPALHRAELADPTGADELAYSLPRGVEAVHESLHQPDASSGAGVDHLLRLSCVQRQRLLAQDVLAGPGRRDRPLGVEVVRQRDVDRVDLVVGQQVLVRAMRLRDPEPIGCGPCAVGVA